MIHFRHGSIQTQVSAMYVKIFIFNILTIKHVLTFVEHSLLTEPQKGVDCTTTTVVIT